LSPLQKRIVVTLAIANAILVCLVIPAVIVLLNFNPPAPEWSPVVNAVTTPTRLMPSPSATSSVTPTRPPPTPVLDEGWKFHRVPEQGFAIGLPPTWESQQLASGTLSATIQALRQTNPLIADALQEQGQQLIAAGVQFFAADLAPGASGGQVITNITVIHQTQKQEFGFDFYFRANLQQLNEMEGATKPLASRRFQTEVGEMGEARYRMALAGVDGQPLTSSVTQYMFLRGKEAYLMTLTTPLALESKNAPVFEKIAKSFRWLAP
jgi:hypothetical protein